jgi:Zn-dependent protease with chaperone function
MNWHRAINITLFISTWIIYFAVLALMIHVGLSVIAGAAIAVAGYSWYKINGITKETKGKRFSSLATAFPEFSTFAKVEIAQHNRPSCALYDPPLSRAIVCFSEKFQDNYTDEDSKAVVSHELGHYFYGDAGFKLALGPFIIIFACLAFLSPVAYLGIIFTYVVMNWFSRYCEYRADKFSASLLSSGDPILTVLAKLEPISIALFDEPFLSLPSIFAGGHPPYRQRYKAIKAYCEKKGLKQELTKRQLKRICLASNGLNNEKLLDMFQKIQALKEGLKL